jgi:aspartate/methionine/tyrosine aminotransferase
LSPSDLCSSHDPQVFRFAPGWAFGINGQGWVRFALVQEPVMLEQAVQRIARFLA